MLSRIYSAGLLGLEARIIEIEVDASYGMRHFNIVGLPDKAIEESKERIGSALQNSGFLSPQKRPIRVLVSLAPADLKKEGSLYDLPIALACLLSTQQASFETEKKLFLGELNLQGKLRPIKGVLSAALLAKKENFQEIILPKENAKEACLVKGLKIIPLENLREAVDYLEKRKEISFSASPKNLLKKEVDYSLDFSYIRGQEYAKRALEIVAAGSHNFFIQGPPGTGKTLLAKALPSILPAFSFEEALEVTKIYSIAGLLSQENPIINARPFRSPHHGSSKAALIGGGNPPMPGEITLAHRGVLFLDEFPEFQRDVLEALRQPLEEGKITILRARHALSLPALFTLVAASNPCPCGNFGSAEKKCACTPSQIQKYRRKLSGPIIDRIDLFVNVSQVKYEKLNIQKQRFEKEKILTNAEMGIPEIKKYCQIGPKAHSLLRSFIDRGKLSARGYHRVLKTARTIADLEESENILYDHIAEALMYRLFQED